MTYPVAGKFFWKIIFSVRTGIWHLFFLSRQTFLLSRHNLCILPRICAFSEFEFVISKWFGFRDLQVCYIFNSCKQSKGAMWAKWTWHEEYPHLHIPTVGQDIFWILISIHRRYVWARMGPGRAHKVCETILGICSSWKAKREFFFFHPKTVPQFIL